jgi:hypothetical protein
MTGDIGETGMRPRRPAQLPPDHPPVLLVVVDTEEAFDWSAEFSRDNTDVSAMGSVQRAQLLVEEFGITPTYVVDYPVASQPEGSEPLRELAAAGRASIGAHLHPWVSPPFDEVVGAANSFPGNLPDHLEREKLRSTVEAIERNIGTRPVIYQAGRYGIGPNTDRILEELGFEVDFSVSPPFDYRAQGGPDFSGFEPGPYWFGAERTLLGLPLTGAFVGFAGPASRGMYRLASSGPGMALHAPGVLSRVGAVERMRLSPEGYTLEDNLRLTRALRKAGLGTFVLSFHSPSMVPGCTPYVDSEADVDALLDRMRRYFDWFLTELGGVTLTPLQLRERLRVGEQFD